jgi:TRAP-type C4-dicarboxylate transport system permease small subunit
VVAEICILFTGVVSRYVFESPLMWTDELANFLFLWLSMLGTVVALRRGEHMRLTTFVNSLRPQWLCAKMAHSQSKHTILSQTSASLAQLCFDLTERHNTREALSRSRLRR